MTITPEEVENALEDMQSALGGTYSAQLEAFTSLHSVCGDMAALIVKLKAKLATCKKYSDAYLKMDQITHKVLCRTEDKLEKAVEALELYSCDDGCNECPKHEQDRASCGWTARAALQEITGKKK